MDWRWSYTWDILPRLLDGLVNTLIAAVVGYALALVLGLIMALLQRTPSRILTRVVREVMEFIRSTPLVLQIFFVYFVGPQFGLTLSAWTAGLIAIGLHYMTYLSEVFRGALDAIPKGQWEACTALNLSTRDKYRDVILPQAVPIAMPGMGNYAIGILKDTPMLLVIGVPELMQTAQAIGSQHYRYLEPYTMVGLIFLAVSIPAAFGIRRLDARVRRAMGMVKSR